MTDVRLAAMPCFILSALLFVGSTVVCEATEVVSEAFWDHSGDKEDIPLNVSKEPVLRPKESPPVVGDYTLKNPQGRVCARASIGVEFIVTENKKTLFFNVDPKSTKVTGYCGDQKSILSLVFDGGNLEFTFIREGSVSCVRKLRASLTPAPQCKSCQRKTYPGIMDHEKLFSANNGQSFKCKSETSLILAETLSIKLVPLQIQAFDVPSGAFGKELECWADYNHRIIPIIVGAVIAGVILIAVLVYVLCREQRGQGYEQL